MTNMLKTIRSYALSLFTNGIFALLPLVLTLAFFSISIKLVNTWILTPVRSTIAFTPLAQIPYIEIVITIILILLMGTLVRFFILRSLVEALESVLIKIPFIRPIYTSAKQLVQVFNSGPDKQSTRKVVLIPYQSPGCYTIGFLTSELPPILSPNQNNNYCTVFVPTTPNPTGGFLLIVPISDVQPIDLSAQEALAYIISGGIVHPDRFINK